MQCSMKCGQALVARMGSILASFLLVLYSIWSIQNLVSSCVSLSPFLSTVPLKLKLTVLLSEFHDEWSLPEMVVCSIDFCWGKNIIIRDYRRYYMYIIIFFLHFGATRFVNYILYMHSYVHMIVRKL